MGFYINSHCKVRICTLMDKSHSYKDALKALTPRWCECHQCVLLRIVSAAAGSVPSQMKCHFHMKSRLLGLRAFTNATPQLDVFEAAGCCHGAEAYISLRHR